MVFGCSPGATRDFRMCGTKYWWNNSWKSLLVMQALFWPEYFTGSNSILVLLKHLGLWAFQIRWIGSFNIAWHIWAHINCYTVLRFVSSVGRLFETWSQSNRFWQKSIIQFCFIAVKYLVMWQRVSSTSFLNLGTNWSAASLSAESFSPWNERFLMPCRLQNAHFHPSLALSSYLHLAESCSALLPSCKEADCLLELLRIFSV